MKNHDIKISQNVLFHEDIFPNCYNIDNNHDFSNDVCLPVNQSFDSSFANGDHSSKPTIENIDKEHNDDINSNEYDNPTHNYDVHRKSSRNRNIPAYLKDYETNLANIHIKTTKYPIQSYVSLSRLSAHFQ